MTRKEGNGTLPAWIAAGASIIAAIVIVSSQSSQEHDQWLRNSRQVAYTDYYNAHWDCMLKLQQPIPNTEDCLADVTKKHAGVLLLATSETTASVEAALKELRELPSGGDIDASVNSMLDMLRHFRSDIGV